MKTQTLQHRMRLEYALLLVLVSVAVAGVVTLIALRHQHDRQAHMNATEQVLREGDELLDVLDGASLAGTNITSMTWQRFSKTADDVFSARPELQSFAVTRDGVTVFHRQATSRTTPSHALSNAETTVSRRTLEARGVAQPVYVISRAVTLPDGARAVSEIALRRQAVDAEEHSARTLVSSFFLATLVVMVTSFGIGAAVLTWALARDRARTERARKEEHLAFSGVLANGILHDFRNPMSAVRLDAQMLEREVARADGARLSRVAELGGRIARTMTRMDTIFHEFLFLAKPADEQPEFLDVVATIHECLDTLAPRLENAGLTAQIDCDDVPRVRAYSAAFRRALLNVLVNATQFAPRNSAIRVNVRHVENHVRIDVVDDGPGVAKKDREQIFEMFVTGRPEGTGLGLFLARTAIERCGGTIRVANSTHGTDIRIELVTA